MIVAPLAQRQGASGAWGVRHWCPSDFIGTKASKGNEMTRLYLTDNDLVFWTLIVVSFVAGYVLAAIKNKQ
jgi:hypothetical protein